MRSAHITERWRATVSTQARSIRARVARRLRSLAAAAGVALLALTLSSCGGGETSGGPSADALRLTYRVEPAGAAAAAQTAQVMRARLAAAGVEGAGVSVSSSDSLTITAPTAAGADVTALAQRGRVAFYDWERSVLGPRGVPAPTDTRVTGGARAGAVAALTNREADARAARVASSGEDGPPGGHVLRAPGSATDRWFVLGGRPALTDADIQSADAGVDQATQEPIVTIAFTPRGQSAFTKFTRTLARRGRARAADRVSDTEASQHFAVVVDDQILALPRIDFREVPNGIDGSGGALIQGGLTAQTARRIAAILSAGPLSAALSQPTGPTPPERHP